MTRRQFLTQTAGVWAAGLWATHPAYAAGDAPGFRLSACDWSLGASGPAAVQVARGVGLDGLEVSAGDASDVLAIADPACRRQYKDAFRATGIVASSVAMGLLNGAPLAEDPRGPAWLEQTIDAADDLGAKVILLAFFGKGDLRSGTDLKTKEVDVVVERLKEAAPRAQSAGVILGIENMLSASQNLAVLDRVKHDAVQVYYDVGNSTGAGYDVPAEIRLLGKRICQFHFKDGKHFLGEGNVKMDPIVEAIRDIGYSGWLVLETSTPSGNRDADFRRNAMFLRKLFGAA